MAMSVFYPENAGSFQNVGQHLSISGEGRCNIDEAQPMTPNTTLRHEI